jgi:hypothetical protein
MMETRSAHRVEPVVRGSLRGTKTTGRTGASRFLLRVLLLLLTFVGCADEQIGDSCTNPDGQTRSGRITGRVIGGEGPVSGAEIMVGNSEGPTRTTIMTSTDSTGVYDVGVRPGSYRVAVRVAVDDLSSPSTRYLYYHSGGVVLGFEQAEPVAVACGTVQADLLCGSATVRFFLPDALPRSYEECELIRDGDPSFRVEESPVDSAGIRRAGFPLVPPGTYRCRISTGNLAVWLRGSLSSSAADTFRIEPGASRALESSFALHEFSGSVTGSWQQMGLSRPRVALCADDPNVFPPVFDEVTNEDGTFVGALLAPGRVRMVVFIDGIQNWYGGGSWESAAFLDIPQAGEIRFPDYVEGGIRCTFAGPGWEDAEITLESADENWHATSPYPDSVTVFPNLVAGTYYLKIEPATGTVFLDIDPAAAPLRPQWFDRAPSREAATPIVIPGNGGVVDVNTVLERGGVLSGHVLRADGTPRGIGTQMVIWTEHFGYRNPWWASRDGSFRIEGLPPGKVKLGAWRGTPAFLTWYPGTLDEGEAGEFDIQGQDEISGIDFRFLP